MGRRATAQTLILFVLLAVALAGCSSADVTFVSDDARYTLEQLEALHSAHTPPHGVANRPVAEASDLRHDALVSLRSRGGEAAEFAEFVTATLSDTGRSVPYYGEAAVVDNTPAWLLIEAWGPEGGVLENTRLWAFARDSGRVLYSSASR
ncbi:MAG: hypothetical protein RBS78_04320 [Coriobacteriia bacterium]|jgi:hypothetical protein|nr:hypothetical protein [Coriobacteriia bacterium]